MKQDFDLCKGVSIEALFKLDIYISGVGNQRYNLLRMKKAFLIITQLHPT